MAAAQKLVAVFLVCMVVLSAMHVVPKAEAGGDSKIYKECFDACQNTCMKGGRGYTDCEMKCDTECTGKEMTAKLESMNS